jgi:hypothetical protein
VLLLAYIFTVKLRTTGPFMIFYTIVLLRFVFASCVLYADFSTLPFLEWLGRAMCYRLLSKYVVCVSAAYYWFLNLSYINKRDADRCTCRFVMEASMFCITCMFAVAAFIFLLPIIVTLIVPALFVYIWVFSLSSIVTVALHKFSFLLEDATVVDSINNEVDLEINTSFYAPVKIIPHNLNRQIYYVNLCYLLQCFSMLWLLLTLEMQGSWMVPFYSNLGYSYGFGRSFDFGAGNKIFESLKLEQIAAFF